LEELKILRSQFQEQLDETVKSIQNLNQKLQSEGEKVNQLRGALYALDVLASKLEQEKKEG
jgi:hypothetical protein